jgi:ferredoxin-NADP reductase
VAGNVHEASVTEIAPLARDTIAVRFALLPTEIEPQPSLRFLPGQFVSLRVGVDDNGHVKLRSYSIAASDTPQEFVLVVKLFEVGPGSHWFRDCKVGDHAHFTGPMGFFTLDDEHPGDVIFAATGVGITPILPMLRQELARGGESRVRLYWSFRHTDEYFWGDELTVLQKTFTRLDVRYHITSGEDAPWAHERGRITQAILRDLPTFRSPTFYLCGNNDMIKELKRELQALGVDRKKSIRTEAFYK